MPSASRARKIAAVVTAFFAVFLFIMWSGGEPMGLLRRASGQELFQASIALAVTASLAALCHFWIRHWFLASITCAVVLDIVVTLLPSGNEPRGPFFLIGLFTVTLFGFTVASVVGAIFLFFRRQQSSIVRP